MTEQQAEVVELSQQPAFATPEDLEKAEFDFAEEVVEIEAKGRTLRLKLRELDVGRRSQLLTGLTDSSGAVRDVYELQVRTVVATVVEPKLEAKQVRRFLKSWPASATDKLLQAAQRLGGTDTGTEEGRQTADEFPEGN